MSAPATVDVVLELGGALAEALARSDVEDRAAARLRELAASLELACDITVERAIGSSVRALRVSVDGVLRPYSPELMARVWDGVAQEPLRSLPAEEQVSGDGFRDSWLHGYAVRFGGDEQDMLADYVAALAAAVLREQPSVLLGADPPAPVAAAGRLLDLGVDLGDQQEALRRLDAYRELGVSREDALEFLFDELRPPRLEIRLNPADAERVASSPPNGPSSVYGTEFDENFHTSVRYLEDSLYAELGLILPDLVVVPADDVRERSVVVRINQRDGPPLPAPGEDELLVAATSASVRELGIDTARPTLNPMGGVAALVPGQAAETVAAHGLTSWTSAEFLIFAVASEVRRRAECLLGAEDVEYRLGRLSADFPELVGASGARFSVEELTRALRRLVAEGISIWDLRSILERLLEFEAVPAGRSDERLFDDRLPVHDGAVRDELLAEFVRTGMKDAVSSRFTWGESNTLVVYLLDPVLEDAPDPERIRDAVWSELSLLPDGVSLPVLLTTTSARADIHQAIAGEFPGLGVVSYGELRPSVNVQPVARIGFAD